MSKRYLNRELFKAELDDPGHPADRTVKDRALRAVRTYAQHAAECPSYDWPKVCLAFAQDALRLIDARERDAAEVVRICEAFEVATTRTKGIRDLHFLHDWLLEQVGAA